MVTPRDKRNFDKTLKEARIGTLEAQYELALMYANGIGTPADIAKAIHWLQQAASKGLAAAQFLLATRYLSGIGVERDEAAALLWLGKAAAQGHAKATLRLGRFLETAHREAALACLLQAADTGLAEAQYAWARAVLAAPEQRLDLQRQAHAYLVAAAEQGLAAAQTALGNSYLQGLGVAPDPAQALAWFRRAAAQGNVQALVALHRLGARSGRASPRRKLERRQSMQQWIAAAEAGDADTRYHLGQLFELGLGLEQDAAQAEHWYRSAALQGQAQAQLALAQLLENKGAFEALDWYRKSAEQGQAQAQFALARSLCSGRLAAGDRFQGLLWYLRAAEQGHAGALAATASLLGEDLGDIARQCDERAAGLGWPEAQFRFGEYWQKSKAADALPQALRWFQAAASQGHAGAQCSLGLLYLEGKVIARDPKLAVEWLRQAAAQGEARAQWNLGSLYASGSAGLARDVAAALDWCQRAAEQGFAAGQATLGQLYARMERWPQAQVWLQRAAAQDDAEALFNLAQLALQSKLPEINSEQALTYLERAAKLGIVPAQLRLGLAYATGQGAALDPIEAHKWFLIASGRGDKAAAANLAHSNTLVAEAARREAARRAEEWSKLQRM